MQLAVGSSLGGVWNALVLMALPVAAACVTVIVEDSDRCLVLKGEKRDIIKVHTYCVYPAPPKMHFSAF